MSRPLGRGFPKKRRRGKGPAPSPRLTPRLHLAHPSLPRLACLPGSLVSPSHLSPRLTCAAGRRTELRARQPVQPPGSAPQRAAVPGPALGPATRSLPVPAPTLPVRPSGRRRPSGPARWVARWSRARARRLQLRVPAVGGAGGVRPRYLATLPASLSPPGWLEPM